VPNDLEIGLELRRAAAMGRNKHSACIGDIQQEENGKKRYHDRELRNIRKNKGGIVLHDRAGPPGQRIDFTPPVMTRIQITSGVKVKTTDLGLLKVKKTGVTDKPSNEVNHDEEAGNPYSHTCNHTRLSIVIHM
jgi:hypothetical protein